jgi:hypothetical protein
MQQIQAFKVPSAPSVDESEFDEMRSASYLPRVSLLTSNSKDVKSGDVSANIYRFESGDIKTVLGKTVDIVPLAVRFTAVLTDDGEGNFLSVHTMKASTDALFQQIKATSEKDGFGSGAMFGPEFLIWVPSLGKFASFFCNNKSARNMAAGIKDLIGKAATLSSKMAKNSKFEWYVPAIAESNVPVTNVPDEAVTVATIEKFTSAKGSDLEPAAAVEPVGREV